MKLGFVRITPATNWFCSTAASSVVNSGDCYHGRDGYIGGHCSHNCTMDNKITPTNLKTMINNIHDHVNYNSTVSPVVDQTRAKQTRPIDISSIHLAQSPVTLVVEIPFQFLQKNVCAPET